MRVILHGDLRRFGERLEVEAKTPREALGKLGIPLEEAWLLAVGDRVVDLDEEVEGPLEVYPPHRRRVVYWGSCLKAGGAKGGEPPYAHPA
jgi:hypothetical protein